MILDLNSLEVSFLDLCVSSRGSVLLVSDFYLFCNCGFNGMGFDAFDM
jgi:hypothetical protein